MCSRPMSPSAMSDSGASRPWWKLRLLPQSLLGRLSAVMVVGVLLTQLVGNVIWAAQRRAESEVEVGTASLHLAHSAASAMRFFISLPPNYRPLIIQQFREMAGTRFLVNINHAPVNVAEIHPQVLSDIALKQIRATLKENLPNVSNLRLAFAWPDKLVVSDDGATINDLPDSWVQHIVLTKPVPAPILLIQAEMEPGNWLYLATLMPNPYFLESGNPLTRDRLLVQALSLAAVLLLSILVVRWTTRPLAALSEAATAFGNGEHTPVLPETGSREFVKTARAFGAMRERIQRYIEDRERLFVSISHDLRTPIMRLKLRAELLDDDQLRNEFHEDLDELDMMVKGAANRQGQRHPRESDRDPARLAARPHGARRAAGGASGELPSVGLERGGQAAGAEARHWQPAQQRHALRQAGRDRGAQQRRQHRDRHPRPRPRRAGSGLRQFVRTVCAA